MLLTIEKDGFVIVQQYAQGFDNDGWDVLPIMGYRFWSVIWYGDNDGRKV